jgi:hypothetical protein
VSEPVELLHVGKGGAHRSTNTCGSVGALCSAEWYSASECLIDGAIQVGGDGRFGIGGHESSELTSAVCSCLGMCCLKSTMFLCCLVFLPVNLLSCLGFFPRGFLSCLVFFSQGILSCLVFFPLRRFLVVCCWV